MKKFCFPKRMGVGKPSVWNEYGDLALKYKTLNLGQGQPDEPPPSFVMEALRKAAINNDPLAQQYARGFGHLPLTNVIANLYSNIVDRQIDPNNEVLITVGAFEAVFASIMGFIDQGDEVILMEPFFDCYDSIVKMAGGTPRYIPLTPKEKPQGTLTSADFVLEDEELEAIFNEKTKMIILNTPHNPLGKVFNREELEKISRLCRKWNVLCISDEVYEWITYDGIEHIRICTLPGMWERSITIGSAGKTFSATGWKIGWAYGPSDLLENVRLMHQNCVYTCAKPLQQAAANCFNHEVKFLNTQNSFFKKQNQEFQAKRDFLANVLEKTGMRPVLPEGGYFMLADWSRLVGKIDLSSEKDAHADYRFTKWMIKNKGLQGIPVSVFYNDAHKNMGEKYVRFCFIKRQENLQKAAELLRNWNH